MINEDYSRTQATRDDEKLRQIKEDRETLTRGKQLWERYSQGCADKN